MFRFNTGTRVAITIIPVILTYRTTTDLIFKKQMVAVAGRCVQIDLLEL
jgi:hypothetical protein